MASGEGRWEDCEVVEGPRYGPGDAVRARQIQEVALQERFVELMLVFMVAVRILYMT